MRQIGFGTTSGWPVDPCALGQIRFALGPDPFSLWGRIRFALGPDPFRIGPDPSRAGAGSVSHWAGSISLWGRIHFALGPDPSRDGAGSRFALGRIHLARDPSGA
jgi:hypothetical protein